MRIIKRKSEKVLCGAAILTIVSAFSIGDLNGAPILVTANKESDRVITQNSLNLLALLFENRNNQKTLISGAKKIAITALILLSVYVCLRYISRICVFHGSESHVLSKKRLFGSSFIKEEIDIKEKGLKGITAKLYYPKEYSLKGKVVLVFSGNSDSSVRMVDSSLCFNNSDNVIFQLANKGATIVGIDYRGYGNSAPISRFKISEDTVYKDGENMYDHVVNKMGIDPRNVITYSHSMGASVASHVLEYASSKGQTPCGAIFFCGSELNTEKNLSKVKNKKVPIFMCSGDVNDVLSLKSTKLDQKCKEMGFKDVTVNIEKCGHNDVDRMFSSSNGGLSKSFTSFIEKLAEND